MNKQQLDEYFKLDLDIKHANDLIATLKNKQWKLKNEILSIGHEVTTLKLKALKHTKRQYQLLGRKYIEVKK